MPHPAEHVQGKNQRIMKRDFKQSRPDKWSEKSRAQPERSEYNNEVRYTSNTADLFEITC